MPSLNSVQRTYAHTYAPRILPRAGRGVGVGAGPEAVYDLFDFRDYVVKIML
jgi:hypothetical protein